LEERRCPDCGLTPVGAELLMTEADHLRRTRPDGTWGAETCDRCERVTALFDREQGWVLGESSGRTARIMAAPTPPRQERTALVDLSGRSDVVVVSPEAGLARHAAEGTVRHAAAVPGIGDTWAFSAKGRDRRSSVTAARGRRLSALLGR
jgi:hypothetical protein